MASLVQKSENWLVIFKHRPGEVMSCQDAQEFTIGVVCAMYVLHTCVHAHVSVHTCMNVYTAV